jgi:hypothetical protein
MEDHRTEVTALGSLFTQLLPSLLPTKPLEICGTLLPLTDILTLVKYSHLALQRAVCLLIVEFLVSQLLEINDLTGRLTMEENRALFEDLAI